jgi:hypothetical protein
MHSAGKAIWTDHYRGSQQLAPLGQKHSWDFNQQSPTHVKAVIQPGDRLVTNCVYNSQTRGKATRFGEGTADEMCFNFLMVYPADGISMCMDIGKVSSMTLPHVCLCTHTLSLSRTHTHTLTHTRVTHARVLLLFFLCVCVCVCVCARACVFV